MPGIMPPIIMGAAALTPKVSSMSFTSCESSITVIFLIASRISSRDIVAVAIFDFSPFWLSDWLLGYWVRCLEHLILFCASHRAPARAALPCALISTTRHPLLSRLVRFRLLGALLQCWLLRLGPQWLLGLHSLG